MLINFDHLKTTYNALVHKLKALRGNWNQNDPAADDYIKNRTHYSEGVQEVEVFPERTLELVAGWNGEILSSEFVEGQTYTVIWNGVEYKCVARDDGSGRIYIGNQEIAINDGWWFPEDITSDEPFFMYVCKEYDYIDSGICLSADGTYVVSISTAQEVVRKLDEKYLPDRVVLEDDLSYVAKSGSYYDLMYTPTVYTDVVRYNSTQSLTATQKSTARSNIGAGTSNFSGSYNDLTNKTHYKTTTAIAMPYVTQNHSFGASSGYSKTTFPYQYWTINDGVEEVIKSGSVESVRINSITYQYRGTIVHEFDFGPATSHDGGTCTGTLHVFGNAFLIEKYLSDFAGTVIGYEQFNDTGESFCYMYGFYDNYPVNTYLSNNVLSFCVINDTGSAVTIPNNVTGYVCTYEQLNEKYIPSTIARVGDSYAKSESDAKYASSWNDLTDKPFYEETIVVKSDTLTWDGNTDGLVVIENEGAANVYYKVSDEIPTIDDLIGGSATIINDSGSKITIELNETNMVDLDGCIQDFDGNFMVLNRTSITVDGVTITFPSTGTYLCKYTHGTFTSSLTLPGYGKFASEQTMVKRLDEKYLPYSEASPTIKIVGDATDGNLEGKDTFIANGNTLYKVSDLVPSVQDIVGATCTNHYTDGYKDGPHVITPLDVGAFDGGYLACSSIVVVQKCEMNIMGTTVVAPSTGIYFLYYDYLTVELNIHPITKIHKDWLPDEYQAVRTAVIRQDDNSGLCSVNLTFEEAENARMNGVCLDFRMIVVEEGNENLAYQTVYRAQYLPNRYDVPCYEIEDPNGGNFYLTADGFSRTTPPGGK